MSEERELWILCAKVIGSRTAESWAHALAGLERDRILALADRAEAAEAKLMQFERTLGNAEWLACEMADSRDFSAAAIIAAALAEGKP